MRQFLLQRTILTGLSCLLLAGCGKIDELRQRYIPDSPREAYEYDLEVTGLDESMMGRAWFDAASSALENPINLGIPYREEGYADPSLPLAAGFSFSLTRGQRLVAEVRMIEPDSGAIFLDLFHVMDEQGLGLRRIALADSTQTLIYDATRTGAFILRMQPELLAGGRFSLSIRQTASVVFPVSGRDSQAIGSGFGAPRDAGRRSHHGVDIFARRNTPVISATDGRVTSVRNGGLGGRVVWVRQDRTGANIYYAHLEEQLVRQGDRVAAGDTLGLVGNSGNARTTPPHLHFGIYRNGPVDPYPFVHHPNSRAPRITARSERAGSWMRTTAAESAILNSPSRRASIVREVQRHTSVYVLAAAGRYFRVRLPDGTTGHIPASSLESEDVPIGEHVLASAQSVHSQPKGDSGTIEEGQAGRTLPVRGRFGSYLRVETESGKLGWMQGI